MTHVKYPPVFIPTLSRYEHFHRCVESLRYCTHADKTELIIGLDYPPSEKYREGYEKIKSYIPQIEGFLKVTLIEHTSNLGGLNNWHYLEDYCRKHYDCYIGSEDDNEFSPCFLDYMSKALSHYKDDPNVSSVSGYSDACCQDQGGHHTYFCYANSAWGLGMWSDKEDYLKPLIEDNSFLQEKFRKRSLALSFFKKFPGRFGTLIGMLRRGENWGDVKRSTINYIEKKYQLRPALSLCRNWGYDGSGEHCLVVNSYSSQEISSSKVFEYEFEPADAESKSCRYLYKNSGLPKNMLKRIYYKLIYVYSYVRFLKELNNVNNDK